MANPSAGNPRAFGRVVVAAGGTAIRATVNQTDPTQRVGLQSVTFQAHPANTGVMYVRQKGTVADDRTTMAFVLGVISAPVSATQGPFDAITFTAAPASGGFNLADFYIDAGVSGNSVIVSGVAG